VLLFHIKFSENLSIYSQTIRVSITDIRQTVTGKAKFLCAYSIMHQAMKISVNILNHCTIEMWLVSPTTRPI